jgi:hypothetical protein
MSGAKLDPRITAARPDLAAAHLKGKVQAARFVEGTMQQVVAPSAPLRRAPSPDAPLDTELLHGEQVVVFETTEEGWAWGQAELDSYVGWIPSRALGDVMVAPTGRVSALRTLVFPGPDIKQPPLESLSFGSRVTVARREGDFHAGSRLRPFMAGIFGGCCRGLGRFWLEIGKTPTITCRQAWASSLRARNFASGCERPV